METINVKTGIKTNQAKKEIRKRLTQNMGCIATAIHEVTLLLKWATSAAIVGHQCCHQRQLQRQ